jgi:hypothetical protein
MLQKLLNLIAFLTSQQLRNLLKECERYRVLDERALVFDDE